MGNAEEKSDDSVDTKVDDATEILPVEENLSTVNIGPFEISPIEENMNTLDICPYEMPIESYGEDVTVAINSCSLLKCTGQTDDQGRDDKWVDCVSDTKCSSIVSSPIEENVCTVNTSFSEVAANIAVEESVFLQPCQLFDAVDNCSLKITDMPDFSVAFSSLECSEQIYNVGRNDSRVDFGSEIECPGIVPLSMEENLCTLNTKSLEFATESADNCSSKRQDVPDLSRDDVAVAINSSNSLKCSRQTYNEGTCDIQVDCGSETKCPAIVPSFSRRSSRAQKPIQKSRTKNIAGKCRKTANVPYPDSSTEIILNGFRKKRSCVSKPARSSMWGLPGNVNQIFEKNIKLEFIGVQSQELQKVKASRGNGKRNKVNASGNSKGSRKSPRALTTCIRLKVKAGKEVVLSSLNVMIPAVVDTSGPANGTTDACGTESILGAKPEDSNLINGIGNKMGNVGTGHYNVGDSSVDCEGGHGDYRDEDPVFTVKDTDSFVTLEKSVRVTAGKYLGVSSADSGGGVNTDLGTSPDSEVINSHQDAEDGSRCQEDLHDSVLTSKDFSALGDVNCKTGSCIQEDGSPVQEGINCAITLNKSESRQKLGDDSDSRESLTSLTIADASTISSSSKEFSTEMLPLSTETEVGVSRHALKVESDREDKACCILDAGLELPESMDSKILLPSTKIKGRKFPKCSKSGGGSKGRSKDSDSAKSRIGNMSRKRENRKKSVNKKEVKQGGTEEAVCNVEGPLETGSNMGIGLGITNTNDNIESVSASYLDIVSGGLGEQTLPPRKAWVCCDDCHKWRRIPASLVDSIGENSKWTCKDNMDKSFADCSISQEKSNAEINAELELSEASGEEDASNSRLHYKELECRPSKGPQPASFTCIPSNEFLHRSRKSQTIDEIMVCHCKPPLDGRMGCGDECLNRMLNIECVRGTCPCGDLCSNQQFQKREYAGMRWFPTGKKGYGLQLLENVSKGQFLIEYVGEVLDMHAYEGRQKQYASDGHKHFYFMTLNGSEVIDASAKGNMGRFINHSCDPNCRTEKWMVNGEICIGLFALKNMKKGEEVTFDYNFVRVFGAAAKKCYCGSLHCQGYIGGDPSNTEIIVQGDSDEEFPEPVMLFENRKSKVRLKNKISKTKRTQKEESVLKARNKMDESTTAAGQSQITSEIDDSTNISASGVTQLHSTSLKKVSSSAQEEISAQTDVTSSSMSSVQEELSIEDDPLRKAPSSIQSLDESTVNLSKLLPNGIDDYKKSKSETHEKRVSSKLAHRLKTSRSSSSVKKGKINSDSQNVNKPQVMVDKNQLQSTKPKKLVEGSANGHFETVEVKLNELLDVDGGISKRKDAPKGYLKLLLLTAASGDSGNGEAIQSNRELSMILDALLKTKSRIVLIDIISKNGLQMLHNIMKQYRRDFKKIPILRKLLKVLEYLAVREILTQEHINGGPPCPGMESFKESILSLTEHDDKQVHQIARSFRDKWIPRQIRKLGYGDRADGREFHRGPNYNRFSASPNVWQDQGVRPTEAIDCVKQAMPTTVPVGSGAQEGCSAQCIGGSLSTGTKTRKRKSRWDQPADGFLDSICHPYKEQKTDSRLLQQCESSLLAQTGDVVSREEKSCHPNNRQLDETCTSDGEQSNIHDDVPPGFSSPLKHPMVPSSGSSSASIDVPQMKLQCLKCPEAVVGRSQGRFISRKPVSYGIPVDILRQFGTSQAENVESWITAPGIPFYPFPPLPPCSRNKKGSDPQLSHAVGADPMSIDQHAAEEKLDPSSPAAPNTQAANQLNVDIPGAKNQHSLKRARGTPDLGKRYFRQQKWNNSKVPPWLWKRNGWGFGNNSRNGTCSAGVGNVENEFRNINSPEGINCRVEKAGNNCYPHPQHQNHH